MYLIDTNVLADYLRDRSPAVRFLERLRQPAAISVLTVAELYAGVRDGHEPERMEGFLRAFSVLPVTEALARAGGMYRREYGPSHGTDLVDGVLAATAKETNGRFVTLNRRHFAILARVLVPYRASRKP